MNPQLHKRRHRRRWSEWERGFLARMSGDFTIAQIAEMLGRTPSQVGQARCRVGVARKLCPKEGFKAFLLEHHSLGWSDREIAEAWTQRHPDRHRMDRHTPGDWRRRLGLGSNVSSEHRRRKVAEQTREQLRKAGLPSIGYLRVEAFKRYARDNGWPEDLGPRHVQVLNAMWDRGPMTRREICAAVGLRWKGSRASLHDNTPGHGCIMATLMARGLVIALGRKVQTGRKGGNVNLYCLSPFIQRRTVNAEQRRPQARRAG